MTRLFWLVAASLLIGAAPGAASVPVRHVVTGCVTAGTFVSGPFHYRVRDEDGKELDLASYEGQTIRLTGWLAPGDVLSISYLAVVDAQCRPDLQKSEIIRE
jgi:hypothetical protein